MTGGAASRISIWDDGVGGSGMVVFISRKLYENSVFGFFRGVRRVVFPIPRTVRQALGQ